MEVEEQLDRRGQSGKREKADPVENWVRFMLCIHTYMCRYVVFKCANSLMKEKVINKSSIGSYYLLCVLACMLCVNWVMMTICVKA